ncbi:hypothetical protein GIW05_01140 [Pseudomonas syringae]|uniref:hypothetical protein n=1 Tax=Pseudomonas syringae TaxID=317 RepID=UPI001F197A0C|nr:hypothetical protein [Pseudomonas syringae]MCF5382128.1 hypothetical protein [Pseudomonas syringae]MCF5423538.1 hypothetical protein [Pseudomonas syringae]MCF5455456.1 hypothetical protein [Pseudomonas syringae]MCF5458281.1 hypothetical protein [Pseudomonas syringae]
MNLSTEFKKAQNLGVIANTWFAGLEARFKAAGIEQKVKTGIDGAASLLATSAFIAQAIDLEQLPADRPLRVLLITDDPVAVMDEGVWLTFAADLAGVHSVECFCTSNHVTHSSLYDPAIQLGLKHYGRVDPADARIQAWDLAVWIHPAIEAEKSEPMVELMPHLYEVGTPVYACMYNELDALIQSHGISSTGLEFSWLHSPIAGARLNKASVNKHGISTAEAGIEGGWGAVITKLQPASITPATGDWAYIKTAMALFRLEGSTSAAWTLGDVVAGVAFNKCQPVGLIGNLAVDPVTGLLLAECPTTKVLNAVGHLWAAELAALPKTNFELVPWAARVKLAFNSQMTREEKKRVEAITMLEQAFNEGMVEAGIALARGFERIATVEAKAKALAIYTLIGVSHPMAAYFLAHDALEKGNEDECIAQLTQSATAGYVPAVTDLGIVMKDMGQLEKAKQLFTQAAELGDAEAAFRKGELLISGGEYDEAVDCLRISWSKGHSDALNTAHWLCSEMLKHGLGKSGRIKRELKDIRFAVSKRLQYTCKLESAVA